MKNIPFALILLFFSLNIQSQIVDNFEDGALTNWMNTTDWANSTNSPISGSRSLQHNVISTGASQKSYIYQDISSIGINAKTTIWRFNLKNGAWDPSSTSKFWFYLLANESDLNSATVDGYAVGINLTGTNDILTLWKVTDGAADGAVITSVFNWNSSDQIGIEVSRTTDGQWTLRFDEDENGLFDNLQLAGSSINNDYTFNNYCGLVFHITDTRINQLWLDDLSIIPDNEPPTLASSNVLTENTLRLTFSEVLEQTSAETITNFSIEGLGSPVSSTLDANEMSIDLVFSSNFTPNQGYSLTIFNIQDISGNAIAETTIDFVYIPFQVEQLFVINKNELLIEFSHPLNETIAETTTNFSVNNGIGAPLSAVLVEDTLLQLSFIDFVVNTNYSLSITNIENNAGVVMVDAVINFTYYPGNPFDLVINELMVDISPSPSVLPATKFVEVYNRTQTAIDLSGWSLQLGDNAPRAFENYILEANDYLILSPSGKVEEFENYGNVLGILSESQLTVSGTSTILSNKEGEMVDYVNYSDSWHTDESKSDGGWSLERVDSENFCGGVLNWRTSTDYKGGTPGKENSAKAKNTDDRPLELLNTEVLSSNKLALTFSKDITELTALEAANYQLDDGNNLLLFTQFSDTSRTTIILQFAGQFTDSQQQIVQIKNLKDFCGNTIAETNALFTYYLIYPVNAYAESSTFVRIIFSEEVETATSQSISNYSVNDGIGNPSAAYKHSERSNEVFLEFPVEFANGSNYMLTIENVTDLNGNAIKVAEVPFSYFTPSNNDLVINELLFNPKPEGVDFVEIYNKANMPVDLSKMSLARRNDEGELESTKRLSELNRFLEPGDFMAISTDTFKTQMDYPSASYDRFLQIPVLPSFNDDEGTVVLLYGDSIIDEFVYDEKMHFALITDEEGISLERIDPIKPTNDPDNWHSAAESVGFATPANQNSQFRQLSDGIDEQIIIEPETFSPNNDGYDDVVFIRYQFDEPGYVANVSIYDGKGRLVKRIVNNELLAVEGEFSWDGLYQNQTKARIGIYVIYFEVFNLQGTVKKTKKICVLAARLN